MARELGVSAATLDAWKGTYEGIQVSEAKRLRQLEDKNRRLKQLVAELSPDPSRRFTAPTSIPQGCGRAR